MKNTSETLLSYAENELIHKEAIRCAALSEAPQKQKRPIVRAKILLPIAACAVLLCGTVLMIPSARAEVARWLHIESPAQYLTEDPDSRGANEQIDSLIVPPVTAETTAPQPTDAPYGRQVTYVCDEEIWQRIARDFQIDLGETMFDGETLYITVTLHGLTALPEIDAATGGNATQIRIPAEELPEYFERGKVPEEFLNGQMSFYDDTIGFYYLEFADGGRLSLGSGVMLWANHDYQNLQKKIFEKYGDLLSDDQRAEISAYSIEWLKDRALIGVVQCPLPEMTITTYADDWDGNPDGYTYKDVESIPYLMQFADENGIVSAALIYKSGYYTDDAEVKLLEAELGTVRFDLGAVDRLERRALTAETPSVTFGPQQVRLSYGEWIEVDYDDGIAHAYTNLPSDLNGLTLSVEDGGYIDALGVHDIRIRITVPQDWTEKQCSAFFSSLLGFHCEIDGKQYESNMDRETNDGQTRIITLSFTDIPYDRIDAIRSLCIVPDLFTTEEMIVGSIHDGTAKRTPMQDNVQYIHPDTDENVSYHGEILTLSDGALTLTVR